MKTEMKCVAAIVCVFLTGCATVTENVKLSVNEHIRFIQKVKSGEQVFPESELNKWRFQFERASMPESAEIKNLSDVQHLLAANPKRYEPYVCYGRCLVTRHLAKQQTATEEEAEAAIHAFENAIEIIKQDKIDPSLNYKSFYCSALYMKYGYERTRDDGRPEAVRWFDKIIEVDPEYIKQHPYPDIGTTVLLAIMDHIKLKNTPRAQALITYAKQLKQMTDKQKQTLSLIEKKMKKDLTR